MMFRIFSIRRRDVTEVEMSAYVDGTLGEVARARIEDRIANSPEARARLDLTQAVVGAMNSADRIRAPKSFALTPAMAYGPARPVQGRGIPAFMPAMAAAAAALAMGLLLVGNLTGSLRQSAPRGEETVTIRTFDHESALEPTDTTVEQTVVVEKEAQRSAAVAASPTSAPEAMATVAPMSTSAVELAVPSITEATPPMMAAAEAEKATQATATAGGAAGPSGPAGFAGDAGPAGAAPVAPAGPASADTPATPVATPLAAEQVTVDSEAGLPGTPSAPEGATEDEVAAEGSGVQLPLWQLEAALGGLAAVFAAAAVALALRQRRSARPR